MKLLLTPYPFNIAMQETTCEGSAFADFETNGCAMTETAVAMIGTEGTVPVHFAPSAGSPEEENEEGYCLQIREKEILISASAEAGYFYGAVTLCQLIRQFGQHLPCLTIHDRPFWKHRGAQVSYAQINVAFRKDYLRRFIDKMSMLKINHVYLYLEWRYQFPSIPETHFADYLSPEDAREMIAYAAARHIVLVPELNIMGHSGDLLAAERFTSLQEYDPETQDGKLYAGSALCPSNPEVRELVEHALNDIMDVFESPVIHVGGDEVSVIGSCPLCAKKKEEIGKAGIYLDYFCWARDILKKRGRKMGIWGDMLQHYLRNASSDQQAEDAKLKEAFLNLRDYTVIYDWCYDGSSKQTIDALADNGFSFICSTSVHGCSVAVPWLGQIRNQWDYFKDAVRPGIEGGLATDWIYGWGYHGEQMGALYASAEAMMWQGIEGDFAAGCTRDLFEEAAAFQYYGVGRVLVDYWHVQGDPDKGVLQFLPGGRNGSYLRRAAYLNDDALAFYLNNAKHLRGKEESFRAQVEAVETQWAAVMAETPEEEKEWLALSGCGAVLFRFLERKYTAADTFYQYYHHAAEVQYRDHDTFVLLLQKAADAFCTIGDAVSAPRAFLEEAHRLTGLESGSIYRLEQFRKNTKKLAAFTLSLADSHRPLPSMQNLNDWLFREPLTHFWTSRCDEWYQESPEFRSFEGDDGIEWGSAR